MKIALVSLTAALCVLAPFVAHAQEKSYLQQNVPSQEKAFELTVATGYTQGFGSLQSNVGMPSVAQAGIGFDLAAGYRIDPRWALSLGGQYQEFDAQRANGARGFAGTLAAQFHIDPNVRLDPWVELGTGYRMLWETASSPAPNVLTHGVEIARARLGLDLRISPEIALSPLVGADATVFLWQDAVSSTAISSPSVATFVFGGIQGRLDLGGTKVGTTTVTSAPAQ